MDFSPNSESIMWRSDELDQMVSYTKPEPGLHSNAPVSVNPQGTPMGNPGDSDSFLTSHPAGYDNGIQTQGQFWHLT